MPVEVGLWRIGAGSGQVQRVNFRPMPDEAKLEDILATDLAIVDPNLLLIGRQVPTAHGKFIDLLAIDPDGKARGPRTQARQDAARRSRPGARLRLLGPHPRRRGHRALFDDFNRKHHPERAGQSLDEAFQERFNVKELPETLNDGHELIIVAGELDPSTERIVTYLCDEYGAAINAVFFRFFQENGAEYLSRVWLIDPGEVETKAAEVRAELPWNGEYYVSFGEEATTALGRRPEVRLRSRRRGYLVHQHAQGAEPGNRIWVNVPGHGYVGVGQVVESAQPITDFTVDDEHGNERPITEVLTNTPRTDLPEDMLEHYVRVHWLQTVPLDQALHEKGFFGNQNTVARPKARKWHFTIERLKTRFGVA